MNPNNSETAFMYHFYINPWIHWFRVDGTSIRVKDFKNIQIHLDGASAMTSDGTQTVSA